MNGKAIHCTTSDHWRAAVESAKAAGRRVFVMLKPHASGEFMVGVGLVEDFLANPETAMVMELPEADVVRLYSDLTAAMERIIERRRSVAPERV